MNRISGFGKLRFAGSARIRVNSVDIVFARRTRLLVSAANSGSRALTNKTASSCFRSSCPTAILLTFLLPLLLSMSLPVSAIVLQNPPSPPQSPPLLQPASLPSIPAFARTSGPQRIRPSSSADSGESGADSTVPQRTNTPDAPEVQTLLQTEKAQPVEYQA